MRYVATAVFVTLLAPVALCAAQSSVESRIESVGLFKNGLAVVTRTIEVDGPGVYVLEEVPTAVHGSFWLESDALVSTATRTQNVEVPLDTAAGSNLREELMGRQVTVRLREPADAVFAGRVVTLDPQPTDEQWSRRYETSRYGWWPTYGMWNAQRMAQQPTGALLLDDGASRHYISLDTIAAVTVHDPQQTMMRRQQVLEVNVAAPANSEGPFTITMTYLAKGITWAPAYLARVGSEGRLSLQQQATIRNELEDIDDVDVYLISGFPNIEFSHVDSLSSPAATIAGFFTQLNQQVGGRHGSRRDVMSQSAVMFNAAAPDANLDLDLDALAEGESSDIHYQHIGKRSIPLGSAVTFSTEVAEADFVRVVEWIIPDDRDEYGRLRSEMNHYEEPTQFEGAWDSIRFRNPYSFPMTTAPMMVIEQGHFAGQRMSYWTNPKELCSVPVTKALSVHTFYSEYEQEGTRISASRFGNAGNLVTVRGSFKVHNRRATPADVLVRRQFSGDLIDAEAAPDKRLLTKGVHSYNPRNELSWNLSLEAGEQREVSYSYKVFILR